MRDDPNRRPPLPEARQPQWFDPGAPADGASVLGGVPPVVTQPEVDALRQRLADVAQRRAFLLQCGLRGGPSVHNTEARLRRLAHALLRTSVVLTYGTAMPVVKVGVAAGRCENPRSPNSTASGPQSYRGEVLDGTARSAGKTPDAGRMLHTYANSVAAMNMLRSFSAGDQAGLHAVHDWNGDFTRPSPASERYMALARQVQGAVRFMTACGVDLDAVRTTDLYSGHEPLALAYEQALTRSGADDAVYGLSGHLLWIGESTRRVDGAYVDFLARVANPVGVKLGPATTPRHAAELVERLDPRGVPGRVTLITHMGSERVRDLLPAIVEEVTAGGRQVVWSCDPVHGNTRRSPDGRGTACFDRTVNEVQGFFEVHHGLGTHPGGLHLELSGEHVTGRAGSPPAVDERCLPCRCGEDCGPYLDDRQSLELAFVVAEMSQQRDAPTRRSPGATRSRPR